MDFFTDCNGSIFDPNIACTDYAFFEDLAAGTQIYIYAGGGGGEFNITATESGGTPVAMNDECQDAEEITVQSGCFAQEWTVSTDFGTEETSNFGSSCDFDEHPTTWYTFTTDGDTELVTLDVIEMDYAVFENDCPPSNLVLDCSTGFAEFQVDPNTTYLLAVNSPEPISEDLFISLSLIHI